MSQCCYSLSQYPLEEHYAECKKFLVESMDWHNINEKIQAQGVFYFDISDVISLFPHLELDGNYRLLCYVSSEYHGIWGHIAALKKDADSDPVINSENDLLSWLTFGQDFDLPEAAVHPMEAIYNDGTPEGYFEAILCNLFLDAIPYERFEQPHWDFIVAVPPSNLRSAWDSRVEIEDWCPRAFWNIDWNGTSFEGVESILVLRKRVENGIGSSDGRDQIYLTDYHFQRKIESLRLSDDRGIYPGHINDDSRYNDHRRCCVHFSTSILVARQKA